MQKPSPALFFPVELAPALAEPPGAEPCCTRYAGAVSKACALAEPPGESALVSQVLTDFTNELPLERSLQNLGVLSTKDRCFRELVQKQRQFIAESLNWDTPATFGRRRRRLGQKEHEQMGRRDRRKRKHDVF